MDVLIPTHWSGGDTAPLAPRFNKIVPTKIHHFQGHSCEKSAAFSDSSTSGGDSWWCSKKMGPGKLQDCHPLDATWGNHRIGLAMGKCKMCVRVSKYIGSMYAQWNPQNYHKWMEQQKTSTTMYHLVSFFQSFETETFNSWHLSLGYSMMLKSFVMWIIGWFMKFYIYKWQSASCCWYWTQSEAVTLQVPIFCRNKSLFVIDFFFWGGARNSDQYCLLVQMKHLYKSLPLSDTHLRFPMRSVPNWISPSQLRSPLRCGGSSRDHWWWSLFNMGKIWEILHQIG